VEAAIIVGGNGDFTETEEKEEEKRATSKTCSLILCEFSSLLPICSAARDASRERHATYGRTDTKTDRWTTTR
jgi:hypothetical protein